MQENEGFVKASVDVDKDEALDLIDKALIKTNNVSAKQIELAITDSYKRLLEPRTF